MVINGLYSNLGPIWISDSSSNGTCIFYLEAEQIHPGHPNGRAGRKFQEIGRHYHSAD